MRDELGAPVRYDKKHDGYILDRVQGDATEDQHHELPGLWFTVSELHALLTVHELISRMQPGLLRDEFALIRQRIESIMEKQNLATNEIFGGSGFTVSVLALVPRIIFMPQPTPLCNDTN